MKLFPFRATAHPPPDHTLLDPKIRPATNPHRNRLHMHKHSLPDFIPPRSGTHAHSKLLYHRVWFCSVWTQNSKQPLFSSGPAPAPTPCPALPSPRRLRKFVIESWIALPSLPLPPSTAFASLSDAHTSHHHPGIDLSSSNRFWLRLSSLLGLALPLLQLPVAWCLANPLTSTSTSTTRLPQLPAEELEFTRDRYQSTEYCLPSRTRRRGP